MPKSLTIFILVLGISQWGCRGSQKYPLLDEEIQNTKSLLPLPKKPKISILASELTNADGLAYHPLKNKLIWSETNNQNPLEDRVSLYDFISKNTSPWFTDAKASGGHWALPSGDIVSLEGRHSARILIRSRFNRPGDYQLLADLWDGKRLLSPKDLAVLPDGSIYFTDSLVNYAPSGINPVDFQGVWKLSLNGQLNPVVKTMKEPKGIAFAPDYSTFYVSDSKLRIQSRSFLLEVLLLTNWVMFMSLVEHLFEFFPLKESFFNN